MDIVGFLSDHAGRLDDVSPTILPHCWSSAHCAEPVPDSLPQAMAAGWDFLVVSLDAVPSRPSLFGSMLWVPLCPQHQDDDTRHCALWVFGFHVPYWNNAIPALDPDRVWVHRACPVCLEPLGADWRWGDPFPATAHVAYTPAPAFVLDTPDRPPSDLDLESAQTTIDGHLAFACLDHAYALWDYTVNL